jgi:hypothetical protein
MRYPHIVLAFTKDPSTRYHQVQGRKLTVDRGERKACMVSVELAASGARAFITGVCVCD